MLAIFSSVLYALAILINLVGFLDLTVLLLKMAIRVPEVSIVLFGIYKILTIFFRSLIALGRASKNQHLMIYWDNLEKE